MASFLHVMALTSTLASHDATGIGVGDMMPLLVSASCDVDSTINGIIAFLRSR